MSPSQQLQTRALAELSSDDDLVPLMFAWTKIDRSLFSRTCRRIIVEQTKPNNNAKVMMATECTAKVSRSSLSSLEFDEDDDDDDGCASASALFCCVFSLLVAAQEESR